MVRLGKGSSRLRVRVVPLFWMLVLPITSFASSSSSFSSSPPAVSLSSSSSSLSASSSSSAFSSRTTALVGLQNLGNTCYLNAQIQAAYHIPRVRAYICGGLDPKEGSNNNNNDEQQQSQQQQQQQPAATATASESIPLQALRALFDEIDRTAVREVKSHSNPVVSTRSFCAALGIHVFQQQDAQEFWKLLLPALQLPRVMDLYQGAYEDYITAADGSGRERRREEPFLDISLSVANGKSVLESLSEQFEHAELLSVQEGNGWRPEKDAEKVDAYKGLQLRAAGLPPILQLHLKRFQFEWETEHVRKINDRCAFPTILNLARLCRDSRRDSTIESDNTHDGDESDESVVYDLQAVVVHQGEYGHGHYYAYVRPNVHSDQWYRFNDAIIEPVDLKEVLCDSYGDINVIEDNNNQKPKGFWSRLTRVFGCGSSNTISTYGYGGPTSNAYVLQYVKRAAVPFLYGDDEQNDE